MAPVPVDKKKIKSFRTQAAFEKWLSGHHSRETELWLRIYKKGAGVASVTHDEAVDAALCWGWIDGLRKALDEVSFLQRFTPRKPRSVWSQINRDRVARLTAEGRITPHGQRHIDAAKADGRWQAAYAPMRSATAANLPADLRAAIAKNAEAKQALVGLKRQELFALTYHTNKMKTPAGRARKISELVALLERGATITPQVSAASRARRPRKAPGRN